MVPCCAGSGPIPQQPYAVRPLRLLKVGSNDFVMRCPAGLGPWADSVPVVYVIANFWVSIYLIQRSAITYRELGDPKQSNLIYHK